METIETAKERSDAWGADIPEKIRWDIYDTCRALPWPGPVTAQLETIGVKRLPSRAGWYRFLARMRKLDAARRIEKIAASVAEAQSVADKAGIKAAVFVETMKTLAIDSAMSGDNKSATALAAAAASIWDRAQKEKELELKSRAQETKDAQLELAKRKLALEEAKSAKAVETVRDTKLTPEEREAKLREIYGI